MPGPGDFILVVSLMGNRLSVAYITALGSTMVGRSAKPLTSTSCHSPLLLESCGGSDRSIMHPHEDEENGLVDVSETSSPVHSRINLSEIQIENSAKDVLNDAASDAAPRDREKNSKDHLGAPSPFCCLTQIAKIWNTIITFSLKKPPEHEEKVMTLEKDLKDKLAQIDSLNQEVQRLKSHIEEREKALEDEKLHTSQLKSKCQKLETQLASIEQKAAQESLTSGSYSDDHANLGMLELACKVVDKATEDLARVLHGMSVTKDLPLDSVELQQFVGPIGPARPAEFSRAIQVRYVWSHYICVQMFQGFEHVFFDVDGGQLTSPLDSKKYTLECFQSFQQKQSMSSTDLYHHCDMFRAFCDCKHGNIFPPWFVQQAFAPNSPNGILNNQNVRFDGDGESVDRFMEVARAVWLLHELANSFDPPACILRMARGTPYEKQFHGPVVHTEDGDGMSQEVALMVRPAFRIRKSIIRSRVFLCKNLPQ